MSHSCPNLVSTSFLYNPYIPFFNLQKYFIYYSLFIFLLLISILILIMILILSVRSAQMQSPKEAVEESC